MTAYARQGAVYLLDPTFPLEFGPYSPGAVDAMIVLALQMRDENEGARLATELRQASDAAEAWLAARDGWHLADFVALARDTPEDEPIRVRIAE